MLEAVSHHHRQEPVRKKVSVCPCTVRCRSSKILYLQIAVFCICLTPMDRDCKQHASPFNTDATSQLTTSKLRSKIKDHWADWGAGEEGFGPALKVQGWTLLHVMINLVVNSDLLMSQ